MVYCGKPSKGCYTCRRRKISCDQKRPSCGQCEKKRGKCPGYRNEVDVMFRDESEHVMQRANSQRRPSKPVRPRKEKKANCRADPTGSSSLLPSMLRPPPHDTPSRSGSSSAATSASPETRSPGPSVKAPTPASNAAAPSPKTESPCYPSFGSDPKGKGVETYAPSSRAPLMVYNCTTATEQDDADGQSRITSPGDRTWPPTTHSACYYTLEPTLSPSFQEQGTAFFFARYVTERRAASHQSYNYLYDIWRPVSLLPERQIDGVLAGMTAVGLAGLSSLMRSPEMMDSARQSYGTALRLTNHALQNEKEALKDTTLLSVLILGTYEMLTGRSKQTVRAWQDHMNGAATLAKLRGQDQFKTNAGIRMFLMLCHTIMISCIQRDIPMPSGLADLRSDLSLQMEPTDPSWSIASPMYKTLQVRYDIKAGLVTDIDDVIRRLLAVEDEFASIIANLPVSWGYKRVRLARPTSAAFSLNCHVYPGPKHATTWSSLRSSRMLIQETILGQLYASFQRTSPEKIPWGHKLQFARSIRILEALRDAQLAGVPQHFGVVNYRDAKPELNPPPPIAVIVAKDYPYQVVPSPAMAAESGRPVYASDSNNASLLDVVGTSKTTDDSAERFMILASARNTILWPLYLIGVSSSCTDEVKQYVVERLDAIYQETSLAQAQYVAAVIRAKTVKSPWVDLDRLVDIPDVSNEPLPMNL